MSVLLRGSASIRMGIERASRGWRHHGSPPSRGARASHELPRALCRNCDEGGATRYDFATWQRDLAPLRSPLALGPVRVTLSTIDVLEPTPSSAGGPGRRVGPFGDVQRRHTGPRAPRHPHDPRWACSATSTVGIRAHPPRRRRTTSRRHEQPTPLTPLGADRPRRHPDQRLSGTPTTTVRPRRSPTPGRPRDQRPTTAVSGGPLPVHPDVAGPPSRSQQSC
jgi:hypothetical protein